MPGLEDELGDVVKKARNGLGLSVEDLAERAGVPEQLIGSTEVYTGRPNEAQVRRLAQALRLRADQLWAMAEDSWSAPEVPWTIGDEFTIDRLTNDYPEHCYIVTQTSGECLIVDPGADAERIVATATRDGRRPVAILITHQHQDHTGAVVPVQQSTGAPVRVHEQDRGGVAGVPPDAVRLFSGDGDLRLGAMTMQVLHTPGHTHGSTTYVLRSGGRTAAFCGDTLFAGSVGNARAGYEAILRSVREKLARLPENAVLYPGHGPATTVANERERNPFL
ncbi:MAG: MBL fold metallo-hydrolase [Chloroflexi bacterium]|nr:MBL fold metallo-hydrolase [Chloroflexota bacterium]